MRRGALSPATAVALLAAAVETLFRRETRWAGLRELASELELPRECECLEGRLEATEPTEERLVGREISWSGSQRRYLAEAGADQETYPGGRHDVLEGRGALRTRLERRVLRGLRGIGGIVSFSAVGGGMRGVRR